MAKVLAICVSKKRQEPKKPVAKAQFIEGKGIEGDSHFGFSTRHVSLLRYEDIKCAEEKAGFVLPTRVLGRKPRDRGIARRDSHKKPP